MKKALRTQLTDIEKLQYIKSEKKGYSGLAATLEYKLGIDPGVKVVGKRKTSKIKLPLLQLAPKYKNVFHIHNAGVKSINTYLYTTEFSKIKGSDLDVKLEICKDNLQLVNSKGEYLNIYWPLKEIYKKINKEIRNIVVIQADNKYVEEDEYFHFNKIEEFKSCSYDKFVELLTNGDIMLEAKLAIKNKKGIMKVIDNGSTFKISYKDMDKLYKHQYVLM